MRANRGTKRRARDHHEPSHEPEGGGAHSAAVSWPRWLKTSRLSAVMGEKLPALVMVTKNMKQTKMNIFFYLNNMRRTTLDERPY